MSAMFPSPSRRWSYRTYWGPRTTVTYYHVAQGDEPIGGLRWNDGVIIPDKNGHLDVGEISRAIIDCDPAIRAHSHQGYPDRLRIEGIARQGAGDDGHVDMPPVSSSPVSSAPIIPRSSVISADGHADPGLIDVSWTDVSTHHPGDTIKSIPGFDPSGVSGERDTSAILSHVVDDARARGSHAAHYDSISLRTNRDLDHVLIDTRGIVLIDSKVVTTGYRVDGPRTWYRANGEWVEYSLQQDLLDLCDHVHATLASTRDWAMIAGKIPVMPLVVMHAGQATRLPGSIPPVVGFVNGSSLTRFLTNDLDRPVTLTNRVVDALADDLKRSTFWRIA